MASEFAHALPSYLGDVRTGYGLVTFIHDVEMPQNHTGNLRIYRILVGIGAIGWDFEWPVETRGVTVDSTKGSTSPGRWAVV